jgi:hypothetical protein
VWNSDAVTKPLASAIVAAFILGTIPLATSVDTSPAMAQLLPANKPGDRGGPDGCVPMGVKKDHDGTVWAVEKCHGQIYHTKMN